MIGAPDVSRPAQHRDTPNELLEFGKSLEHVA
jgi:hypothetical protein